LAPYTLPGGLWLIMESVQGLICIFGSMNKRVIYFFAGLFIFLAPPVFSQSAYFKTIGKFSQDYTFNIQKTLEGGFIMCGISNSYGGSSYLFMIKTDANGDTNWVKGYVTTNTIYGWSVFPCTDSGFAVCGNTGFGKVDKNGNMLWTYLYPGAILNSIRQTADGGFILAGSVGQSGNSNGVDVYLLKTDANGTKQWSRKLGGPADEYSTSVRITSDGGYILAGSTDSYGAGAWDTYVIKTDASGDTLWTRTYGGSSVDGGVTSSRQTINETFDGGYIIGGYSTSFFTAGGTDAYLIKTDVAGDVQWSKLYGGAGSDLIFDVRQCADSGYVFTGYTTSFGGGGTDIYLVRTDVNGDTLFTRTFGDLFADYGQSVLETDDKGFLICGYTTNFGSGNNDVALIKTDSMGNTSCYQYNTGTQVSNAATQTGITATGKIFITVNISSSQPVAKGGAILTDACLLNGVDENAFQERVSVFPNPNSGAFSVALNSPAEIRLRDILGNTLYTGQSKNGQNIVQIDLPEIAPGTYFLELFRDHTKKVHKILICR